MNYQESLTGIADQAFRFYQANADDRLFFHNLAHTNRLLDAVGKIQAHYQLDEKNLFVVTAAAWLLDLEIIHSGSFAREIKNTQFSDSLLQANRVEKEITEEIKNCILAACSVKSPASLNENIFCDANTFYFGSENFEEYNKLMRREIEAFTMVGMRGAEWRERTIARLENHQYHTEYCQSLLNKTKQQNLQVLVNTQAKKQSKNSGDKKDAEVPELAGLPPKAKHHLRAIETMFRNSSSNHMRLSVMADNKAFIMISVNSILISVGIGLIIGKFVLINHLFIPTILLMIVNIVTIIYSVLATRPGHMKGTFTREEVDNRTVDLLFFGNFYNMPLEDYKYGMRKMMDDADFLYGTIIKDIYLQARTLGRKFRLLRYSYNIFMYGMAATVIVFLITFLM